ncbi:LysR family transcriptional regulator [Bradymonas sediminis]|uniref:Uncharacterized protein n=1 Tax=Bradymonas sediminis TaxID=1548548 RepID=A0A2Z4FP54_9DELT|nr:LysR family transcriptional regulator [Bradymonas sediminis]AWV90660.1 hypothetical protein DN745_15590 [Bradymonas sediminis]TDP62703.1 LysR family cyn operon transcriptional activator [Bradymonas sediminis]
MDINQLHAFLAVAREGQMTRAARQLHRTQPAISAQIAKLEEDLGQRLFDRTSTGMVLSDAGRTFRGYAQAALARLEDGRNALDQLRGMQRGSLSIGGGATATTYLLPSILGRFHAKYPGIRFFVREQPSKVVIEQVLEGQLDLGVVTLPIHLSSTGSDVSTHLEVEEWVQDEMRLIVPPGHALHGRREFAWSELAAEPLVLFEAGSAVRGLLDRAMSSARVDVDIVMELRSIESIKQMVAQGIGCAFVSQFALSGPGDGLRCIEGPIQRRLAVIYRNDRTQSPAARAFLGMMHA